MLKTLHCFILLFLSYFSFSQVQQTDPAVSNTYGQVSKSYGLIAKIYYKVVDGDTTFSLLFKNLDYQHLEVNQVVNFKNSEGTLDTLYSILARAFEQPKLGKLNFKLGNEDIETVRRRHMGFNGINIVVLRNNANFGITRKDLDLLFGKTTTE